MKIGILECDDVPTALQRRHGNYPAMFETLLYEQDDSLDLVFYRAVDGDLPAQVDECDAYITTGSRHSVNDPLDWVVNLLDFVCLLHDQKKKLIGICFGHQLIAKALGGQVKEATQGWGVGVATHEVMNPIKWLSHVSSIPNSLSLLVSHKEQVVLLPENSQVLMGNEFCPHYMIQIGEHFLGVQGHPEFTKAYSKDLMLYRKERLPKSVLKQGLDSLGKPIDNQLIASWLLRFLRD